MKKKRILAFLLTMALAVTQLVGTHGLTVQAGLGVGEEGNGTDIPFEGCTHTPQETQEKPASCTKDGNIHYYHCEECGVYWDAEKKVISEKDTILAATGHSMTFHEKKEPTCKEEGNKAYYYCSNCKKNFEDKAGETALDKVTLEKIPHSYNEEEWSKNASHHWHTLDCTHTAAEAEAVAKADAANSGWAAHKDDDGDEKCDVCGANMHVHNFDKKVTVKEATCTTKEVYRMDCDCGEHGEEKEGVLAPHTPVTDKEVPATCTTAGKTEGSHCSVCKTTIVAQKTVAKIPHTYKTVVKKVATTSKDGQTVEKCSSCGTEKNKKNIYKASKVSLKTTTLFYNGKAQKPAVIVKDSKGKTISSKYYNITWTKGLKNVGTYKGTVTFKGNYSGSKTLSFKIVVKPTAIKGKLTAAKKGFTVKWSKQSKSVVDGYQVQYSTDKKFKKSVTKKTVKNTGKTVSYKASKLKGKTKYYVKVRSYKKIGKKTYYSDWSSVQNVKTK